jgi:hypothetical protein
MKRKYLLILLLANFIITEVASTPLPDQQVTTITRTFTSTTTCQSDIQQTSLGKFSVSVNNSLPLTIVYQSNISILTSAPLGTSQPVSPSSSTPTLSVLPTSTGTSSRECLLQIWESVLYNLVSMEVHLNVTVPGVNSTYKEFNNTDFGQTATVSNITDMLPLPYNVSVFFTNFLPPSKYLKERRQLAPRLVVPPPATTSPWKEWVVEINAGLSQWTSLDQDLSALPFCQVGSWGGERIWVRNSIST